MNFTEDVTVRLANDGMIVGDFASAKTETEYYIIPDASLYTGQTDLSGRTATLSRLWLIWFSSLPLLAAIIYVLVHFLGS